MTQNKYINLNEERYLKYIEEKEMKKVLQISKNKFDKTNKKQKDIYDNQVLVAKLNSELSNIKDNDRHVDAALIDSDKLYLAEQHMVEYFIHIHITF